MIGRGLINLFKYFSKFFKWIFTLFGNYKRFLPVSMVGIFLVSDFFSQLFSEGLEVAVISLAQKVLAAEQTINTNVSLALENSSNYGLLEAYAIFVSCYMLWILFKNLKNMFEKSQGANVNYGSALWALIIIALLEVAVMNFTEGVWFIPIKDGIWYLAMNIKPVLYNITIF